MDRILLQGMVFKGRHGVTARERARPQEFSVDIELETDLAMPFLWLRGLIRAAVECPVTTCPPWSFRPR